MPTVLPCPWCQKQPTIYDRDGQWHLIHQCGRGLDSLCLTFQNSARSHQAVIAPWNDQRLTREVIRDIAHGVLASSAYRPGCSQSNAEAIADAIVNGDETARQLGSALQIVERP